MSNKTVADCYTCNGQTCHDCNWTGKQQVSKNQTNGANMNSIDAIILSMVAKRIADKTTRKDFIIFTPTYDILMLSFVRNANA